MRKKILPFTAFFMMLLSGLIFSSSIIDAQTKRGTYTTTADVPLRAGPGTNHPIITTFPKGIKIDVVSKEGSWLKVESKHGDKPGYIEERFAHLETTAKTPAPKTRNPHISSGRLSNREGRRSPRRTRNEV
jgi:uncharacterized protein YgiM (DUF1202 family)